jgi:hypothetical protein
LKNNGGTVALARASTIKRLGREKSRPFLFLRDFFWRNLLITFVILSALRGGALKIFNH